MQRAQQAALTSRGRTSRENLLACPPTGLAVGLTATDDAQRTRVSRALRPHQRPIRPIQTASSEAIRQWVPRSPPSTETTRQGRTMFVARSLDDACDGSVRRVTTVPRCADRSTAIRTRPATYLRWARDRFRALSLTCGPEAATIERSGQPRPPVGARLPTFLHLEDDSTAHMHVALGDGLRGHRADAAGAGRPRRSAACTWCRATASGWRIVPLGQGRPVWTDDPHFNPRYHIRHTALPRPADDDRAQAARRAALLPAPGPLQAAVGDLARASAWRAGASR